MIEIALKDVEKYYGANHVLKGVTFEVNQGERVGLLGKNGAGKTTLFKVIAGMENCDAGSRMIRKGVSIGLLEQIPVFSDGYTASDVLYSAFNELHSIHGQMVELEKQMASGTDIDELLKRYGRLQQAFEAGNGYGIEENISRVCMGLKIDSHMSGKSFNLLSGGEKTRVMLGRLILQNPDIILLDEPTNHLDLSSMEWLEEFLRQYKGTVVIISHDRYFLDHAITRIVEIKDGKAEIYQGNYSYYVKEKEERYLRQLEKYEQEQKKIKQLETAAKRLHEWAQNADNPALHSKAFAIEKRIERMDKTDKPLTMRAMDTNFNEYQFSGKDVIVGRSMSKAFGQKIVLDTTDFTVQKSESVAVLGDNGCGKSTLIKAVTGEAALDSGSIKTGESIKYAYLPQMVTFEDQELTILDTVSNALKISEGTARNLLAGYRFRSEDVYKIVKNLSGGEKSRLRLCILMQDNVNLLILDEPTNHLDIDSREWLENSLMDFGGTILFVSHDRYFINKFATRISELKNGRFADYYGDYEFYKNRKLVEERQKEEKQTIQASCSIEHNSKQKRSAPVRDDKAENAKKLETAISELEAGLMHINEKMALNADDFIELNSLHRQKCETENELDNLYKQWMLLNES